MHCYRGFLIRCKSWEKRLLPDVRIQMFTLSFPFDLRRRLAFHHDEVLAVHRLVTRAIAARYLGKARALGVLAPRPHRSR